MLLPPSRIVFLRHYNNLILVYCFHLLHQGDCPPGWTSLPTGCYFYITGYFTWLKAVNACKEMNSKLIEVETRRENEALRSVLPHPRPRGVWIGVSDIIEEGLWIWNSTGEKAAWSHVNHGLELPWIPGTVKPDDSLNCAFQIIGWTNSGFGGRWKDGWCLMELEGALCELPKNITDA